MKENEYLFKVKKLSFEDLCKIQISQSIYQEIQILQIAQRL